MKGCFFAFIFFCIIISVSAQDSRATLFNADWKFQKNDVKNGFLNSVSDASWRTVNLPHDWSIEGPFSNAWASGTGYLPGGVGWYRKRFTIPKASNGSRTYIYFDGVYKNSEVWINEKYLGKRPNGYSSFYYDLTPHLKEGGNLLAVRVDHTDFADSRWYTGSGINRNVYLITVDPVHFGIWGLTFTTPQVDSSRAKVNVVATIKNYTSKARQVVLSSQLINNKGQVQSETSKSVRLARNGGDYTLSFDVADPRLWSPESPELYYLKTVIKEGGKVLDSIEERVGFRYFSFDADRGFFLNSQNMKLKGVCFHDDAGALGSAVPKEVWHRRLKTLKDLGCNAIRMSHNPHQDYLYALCDEMGFLVQDEAFDEWEIGKNKWIEGWNVGTPGKDGYSKDFNAWAERDVRDMILRNKNRPSIIMWSIGNEIDYPNDPYTHEVLNTGRNPQIYGRGFQPGYPPAARLGEIAARLAKVVREHDPTRPVTAALAGVVMSNTTTYPSSLDVVGYNYQEYRYDEDHKAYPDRIIYGSENSKSFDAWKAVADREFISGQFLWTAFDFLGEARAWPVRSSGAGLIDMAGFPKPEFYHRKSIWSAEPVLSFAASRKPTGQQRREPVQQHWNWTEGDSLTLYGYSNLDEVELIINGISLGRKSVASTADQIVRWSTVFQPGELVLKGYIAGRLIKTFSASTAGKPFRIKSSFDKGKVKLGEVVHVEIDIQDVNGKHIGNADNEVSLSVEGPGKLVGLESGSLTSHEDYQSNTRKAFGGRLLAYVQASGQGKIKIKITSPNLEPDEISILGSE